MFLGFLVPRTIKKNLNFPLCKHEMVLFDMGKYNGPSISQREN